MYPKRNAVYTLDVILNDLNLRDSASLGFRYKGRNGVIQDAHVTTDDLLTVPGIAATQWRYERETFEWIPIFHYVGGTPLEEVLDFEPYLDPCSHEDTGSWWATPKGFPRKQYLFDL